MTGRGRRAGTATVATFFAVVPFVAASGIAGAGHGPEEAYFTVEPPGDRSSGTTDVECGRSVVATAGVNPETPAKNEGDGVGLAVALLGLLVAALIAVRRH